MDRKQDFKNFFIVVFSNLLTIVVSLFMGFFLPKLMTVEDYAYYRVYCLYVSYAGFFHLGFINGIYLKYGEYDFEQLPKSLFRNYHKFMLILQMLTILILSLCLFIMHNGLTTGNIIAFIFIIINIPLVNIKCYFSTINQFTKRFIIDSYLTFLQTLLNVLIVISVVVFHLYDFKTLLILVTINNFACMALSAYQNKEIILGTSSIFKFSEVKPIITSGFFLMISDFVGVIILGIDSIFVQNLFTLSDFAVYSFAVSVISTIYSLIATVSNLVYPYLARVDNGKYAEYYCLLSDIISIISGLSFLGFYVVKFLIENWISKYEASISIISILFGTILFRSIIVLVCGNYFKVLKMIKDYTTNMGFAILLTFILDVLAYVIFKDFHYIAIASLLSFIIWYFVTDYLFIKRLKINFQNWLKRYSFILLTMIAFYLLELLPTFTAFILYFIIEITLITILYRDEAKFIFSKIFKKNI